MAGDQLIRPVGEPTRRDWIAVMSVMLGAFMAVLDIQITNSSLKDIQGALSATLEEGSWISTSYLVAEIIMIPLTAWLVQLLSARRLAVWVSLGFLVASAMGIAASASPVLSLIVLFVVAAVSAVLCLGLAVGPPGALFFVLVAGVSGHVAGPTSLDGGNVNGWLVLAMLALGLVIAYLVVLAPLVVPRVRAADGRLPRDPMRFEIDETIRIILTRLIVATGIAVLAAAPLGIHRAYWVVVAVVAILQNGHRLRLTAVRGVHRVLGTLVGLGLFALIFLASPSGVWLGVLLMALQFVVELVVIRNYGLALVFITPLALTIAAQAGTAEVGVIVGERFADTVLGAAIATAVLLAALAIIRWRARGSAPGAAS